ncbi:succinylglutamate desuccinylase/aspartoacylase domain-containing protein [Natronomonas sp.]|uniref:succinylglutamate desuccinylase/aspartoacylase domain-containing protein n=1 Tax=Natronomonas sp. TaxID=2184060 RepID=UPI002613C475|nr:succinylglutamate desuccinylase/aspartoacylase family protein [Natronomonas sp.]
MKLIERGSGSPRLAVVGGIHGDEPAGVRIVERLADTLRDESLSGTVQLIVANEPALERGERYTDTDLNRTFPGDEASDDYETALAARLEAVLTGADAILALHTSQSAPPAFAIFSDLTESVRRTVTGLPVEHAVDSSDLRSTTLDSTLPHTVSLEAGRQGSETAVSEGYEAAIAFLRAHGALTDEDPVFTETAVIAGHEEVPKGTGEPHVYYSNFQEIPKGEVFARDDTRTHRVDREGVVPVLASEHGYEDIFGVYGSIAEPIEPPETT